MNTVMNADAMSKEAFLHGLRVRRATRADLAFVAWCNHESSSPSPGFCYWDPLLDGLNTPTLVFIEALFRVDALAYGKVEDFFVVESEGRLIAGASGFTPDREDYRPLRLDRLAHIAALLGWTAAQQAQFLERYQGVWADPRDPSLAPQAPWIIECVAVLAEYRGRGVARALLNAILDEGRRLGHSQAGISVTHGNTAAQHVYEAIGFKLYLDYGAEYFDGYFPGTTKYHMRLDTNPFAQQESIH